MSVDPEPIEVSEAASATPVPTPPAASPSPVVAAAPSGTRLAGKVRNPWAVWGLSIITLGIYFLYWYYKVNAEVRDYDRSIEVEPAISVVAQFIPIASLVSMVKTAGRISRAQSTSGISERCSGLIGFLLIFVLGTWVVYYQSQLNKVWEHHGSPVEGTPV